MQPQQQVSPDKLFAIIGEQQTQLVLLREQATALARMVGDKDRQLKLVTEALEALKQHAGESQAETPSK